MYNIKLTNGDNIASIPENVIDADTVEGISLIGKLIPNYGQAQSENFIHLTENFAQRDEFPKNALEGELCYRIDKRAIYLCVERYTDIDVVNANGRIDDVWHRLTLMYTIDNVDIPLSSGDLKYDENEKSLSVYDAIDGIWRQFSVNELNIDEKILNHHDDTKQDKLVSGQNIKTINNESLLGNGNIALETIVPIDNDTIEINSKGDLEVNKIKDSSNHSISVRSLTQSEYDSLSYHDSYTIYNITDKDNNEYKILQLLYPVGSLYISTSNTCPLESLISGSQWQLVAQDRALWGGNGNNANTNIQQTYPQVTVPCQGWGVSGGHPGTIEQGRLVVGSGRGEVSETLESLQASGNDRQATITGNIQPPAYRVNVWRRIV